MMLRIGSRGQMVKELQKKIGVRSDGIFGPQTDLKLREWQKANGLTADGIAGPATLGKMGIQVSSPQKNKIEASHLKLEKLKDLVPDSVISQIPNAAEKFNITNSLRLSHFLSQCAHESGRFKTVVENLNYTSEGLRRTFSDYFPGNLSESYARQPERIANRVYSSRMGNGNESSGDGWKYIGRGFIQLTGKSNYESFDRFVDDDILSNPDLVATKYPLESAAFFFNHNNLWTICDRGYRRSVVEDVTRRVNGGLNGIEDRWSLFGTYFRLLK